MTQDEKKIEFAVFCIEGVAERLGELPERVYDKLCTLGLMDDLILNCYDSLHTQSKQHIIDDVIEAILLQMKYVRIVIALAERLHISSRCALGLFYQSDTYKFLRQKIGDLHCMSDAYLVDELVIEYTNKQGS